MELPEHIKRQRLKSWDVFFTKIELLSVYDDVEFAQKDIPKKYTKHIEKDVKKTCRYSIEKPGGRHSKNKKVRALKRSVVCDDNGNKPSFACVYDQGQRDKSKKSKTDNSFVSDENGNKSSFICVNDHTDTSDSELTNIAENVLPQHKTKVTDFQVNADSDTDSVSTINYILECRDQLKKTKTKIKKTKNNNAEENESVNMYKSKLRRDSCQNLQKNILKYTDNLCNIQNNVICKNEVKTKMEKKNQKKIKTKKNVYASSKNDSVECNKRDMMPVCNVKDSMENSMFYKVQANKINKNEKNLGEKQNEKTNIMFDNTEISIKESSLLTKNEKPFLKDIYKGEADKIDKINQSEGTMKDKDNFIFEDLIFSPKKNLANKTESVPSNNDIQDLTITENEIQNNITVILQIDKTVMKKEDIATDLVKQKSKNNSEHQSFICSTPYKHNKRKREILDISVIKVPDSINKKTKMSKKKLKFFDILETTEDTIRNDPKGANTSYVNLNKEQRLKEDDAIDFTSFDDNIF